MNWKIVLAVMLTIMFYANLHIEDDPYIWQVRAYAFLAPLAWGWALA
jgi:hypothetical protein